MNDEKELKKDCLEELDSIDISDLKLKLIMEFSNAIFSTNTITDLILLVYRNPVCLHQCGISDVLMSVMNDIGIDDQDYHALYVESKDESNIADDNAHTRKL